MKEQHETTLNYKTFLNDQTDEWVVFLHGFGGNYNIFHNQMDYFKEHFNLLFIDLPGHGQIAFPGRKYLKSREAFASLLFLSFVASARISGYGKPLVALGRYPPIFKYIYQISTCPHCTKALALLSAGTKFMRRIKMVMG